MSLVVYECLSILYYIYNTMSIAPIVSVHVCGCVPFRQGVFLWLCMGSGCCTCEAVDLVAGV